VDTVGISAGGSEKLIIDSTGSVGIGISPGSSLHISRGALTTVRIDSDSSGAASKLAFGASDDSTEKVRVSGAKYASDGSTFSIECRVAGNGTTLYDKFNVLNNGNVVLAQDGGNVLIGTTTDDGVGKLQVAGNITTSGFSKLGDVAPKIKMKKLTGYNTSGSDGGATTIPHGLTSAKILSVSTLVFYDSNGGIHPGYEGGAGYNFSYAFDANNVTVILVSGQNVNIRNKPIVVLITYEE
jgi:hypothetical protein